MTSDASNTAVASRAGVPVELPEEGSRRTPWFTLLFITAVFYAVDHNFFASVDVSIYGVALAAEKATGIAEGSLTRRLGYLAFGLYGAVAWLRVPRFRLKVGGLTAAMLLIYLGWAVLSLAWSQDPTLTLRRLSALGLMALGITGLLRQYSGTGIMRLICFMTLSYLVMGVSAELALGMFTPWSSGYRFAGTLYPNIQAINCAGLIFSALALTATVQRSRPVLLAVASAGAGFLILTGSRTALLAGMIGLSALWTLRTRPSVAVMTGLVVSCLGLLGTLLVVTGLLPSPLGVLLRERFAGGGVLSGRPDLWAILLEYARERPILGYGYGAFFDPERGLDIAARVGTWAFGGPHSLYLGTLLDLGAVGLACVVGVMLGSVWRSVRAYRQTFEPHYLLFTALLVFEIVDGFAEAEMLSPNPHLIPGLAVAFLAFGSRRGDGGDQRAER